MNATITRRTALGVGAAAFAGLSVGAAQKGSTGVAIVVGPSQHPPGTHEVEATGRLLKHTLEVIDTEPRLRCTIFNKWTEENKTFGSPTSIVFVGDLFPPAVMPESEKIMTSLADMMGRGVGIVCLHYATGLEAKHVKDDGSHPLLNWIGGYFATRCKHHQSVAKVFPKATIEPAKAEHEILRGWKAFTVHDEPYINNYFGKDGPAKNVTILATSQLPPEKPKAETVAWAVEREDGGRGVGIVMPHFFRNWRDDNLRTFLLNAILWSARHPVPNDGVQVKLPDLTSFKPASVEPVPKKKP